MCNILAIISQIGDLQNEKIILDFFWVVPHLCLSIYLLLVYKLSTITNTSIMSSPSDLSASLLPLLPLRATSGPSSRSKVHEQTKSCSLEREFCLKLISKLISCLKGWITTILKNNTENLKTILKNNTENLKTYLPIQFDLGGKSFCSVISGAAPSSHCTSASRLC